MNARLRYAATAIAALTLTLSLTACSTSPIQGDAKTPDTPPASSTPTPSTNKGNASSGGAKSPTLAPPAGSAQGEQSAAPAGDAQAVDSLNLRWEAGVDAFLLLYGTASVPDLHLEIRSGSEILGQADTQVKEGRFLATLHAPAPGVEAEVWVSTLGPNAEVVAKLPVPQDRWVGAAWSANFAKVVARQLDAQTVLVSGEARVFEGVFAVQIQVDGQVKATKQIKAAQGAPAFSPFEEQIKLDQPLPQEGVEAYFLTQSPKDGSNQVELFTNVMWGK